MNQVFMTDPTNEFYVEKLINYDFNHITSMTLFKNYIVMYNSKTKNYECLACILKDGIIYTLYY